MSSVKMFLLTNTLHFLWLLGICSVCIINNFSALCTSLVMWPLSLCSIQYVNITMCGDGAGFNTFSERIVSISTIIDMISHCQLQAQLYVMWIVKPANCSDASDVVSGSGLNKLLWVWDRLRLKHVAKSLWCFPLWPLWCFLLSHLEDAVCRWGLMSVPDLSPVSKMRYASIFWVNISQNNLRECLRKTWLRFNYNFKLNWVFYTSISNNSMLLFYVHPQ